MKTRVTVGFAVLTNINFVHFLQKNSKKQTNCEQKFQWTYFILQNNRIENSPIFLWVERKSVILLCESIFLNVNSKNKKL